MPDQQVGLISLSRRFCRVLDIAIVMSVATLAVVLLVGPFQTGDVSLSVTGEGPVWLSRIITALTGTVLIVALFQLRAMLTQVINGDAFGPRVRGRLKTAAVLMLAACLIGVLAPLMGPVVTPSGRVSLSLSGSDGLWLLTSLTFYFVARWIEAAAAFETDSREIV